MLGLRRLLPLAARAAAALFLLIGSSGVPAPAQEQQREGGVLDGGDAEEILVEEVAFSRAAVIAIDSYMEGLKAVQRWQDAVTPVVGTKRSLRRRQAAGGNWATDLLVAGRRWQESQGTVQGLPSPGERTVALRATLLEALNRAMAAVTDFRLVGAELDAFRFGTGAAKLCLANEKGLQATAGIYRLLRELASQAMGAELFAIHGYKLELHAAYLRTKGCRMN